MRDTLIKLTRNSTDFIIYRTLSTKAASGEELAAKLGVTRKAVWKAIEKLRSFGFEIEASKRTGYVITAKPELNPYDVADIAFSELKDVVDEVHYYSVTDSTNERARIYSKPGVLIFAEEQTAGKGRLGRRWESGKGGLYFTLTLKPEFGIEDIPKITLTTGLAVAKAIGGRIKWPNDVLINGKKVCGILCELAGEIESPIVIIGVGVNVKNEIPKELKEKAARLCDFFDCTPTQVFRRVLAEFYDCYNKLRSGKWDELRSELAYLCETIGKRVKVLTPSGVYEGIAEQIAEDGALVVNGRRIYAGECVHLRL